MAASLPPTVDSMEHSQPYLIGLGDEDLLSFFRTQPQGGLGLRIFAPRHLDEGQRRFGVGETLLNQAPISTVLPHGLQGLIELLQQRLLLRPTMEGQIDRIDEEWLLGASDHPIESHGVQGPIAALGDGQYGIEAAEL